MQSNILICSTKFWAKLNIICEKCFAKKSTLNMHQMVHTGEKPHKCEYCERKFSRKRYLEDHMKNHICFNIQDDFGKPIRIHKQIDPIQCTECDRIFNKKSNYKVHLLTHTGEKPHKCSYCEKGFTRKGYMVKHMKSHT